MYQQAKAANEEALQIYEDLQHPELGAMYTVLGNMAIDRYRNLLRGAERLEMEQSAINFYEQGMRTIKRMGVEGTDESYSSCFYCIGLVHQDRGESEQAMPYVVKAAVLSERHLGNEHPSTVRYRRDLADALRGIGRWESAAEVEAGGGLGRLQRELPLPS